MDMDLDGKVALVTGGSRGLGRTIAEALGREGVSLAICGRKQNVLDQALSELQGMGMHVIGRPVNIGRAQEVKALFEEIEKTFGRLDILINNVGMNILTPSVSQAEEGLWDKILETNLKGPFLVSREAVRLMKAAGGGRILNISSIAGRKAAMGMGIYCIAKAGLDMLTRVLAVELAQDRITVNGVAPGMVRTQFSMPFWSNTSLLPQITAGIPMGRIAEPQDVVGLVLFLVSRWADYITGEVICVDGGAMA